MIPKRFIFHAGSIFALSRCLPGLAVCAVAGAMSVSAHAEPVPEVTEIVPETIVVRPAQRRAELRRALESSLQQGATPSRRRLSQEEREALHRDLRAVMRNVNADQDDGRSR
ncbi:MAG: hypothetical protein C0607_15995 [Azoarcus sp.]|nr:MAG: hypothetical protein C0607_15995 [Azoarcus sp.]